MKTQELNGVQVWKDFEAAANRRDMNVIERALYSYLLLHTRLEGKSRLHFTLPRLSRSVRMSRGGVRNTLRRLSGHGALRFIERSYKGYLIECAYRRKCPPRAAPERRTLSRRPNLPPSLTLKN